MIIIGELINATRNKVREAVMSRDAAYIVALASAQKKAGSDYIDLNVGTGLGDSDAEIESMRWAVDTVIAELGSDTALCMDSANIEVLKAGLERAPRNIAHMLNSVTAESGRLEPGLDLAAAFGADIIALAMDDSGIPGDMAGRLGAVAKIHERAVSKGIKPEKIFFDPLAMPLSTDAANPGITLACGREIRKIYSDCHLSMGLSNTSHGLPERKLLNRVFLAMAVYAGFDAAILDPCDTGIIDTISAAEALCGKDEFCMNYISHAREKDD